MSTDNEDTKLDRGDDFNPERDAQGRFVSKEDKQTEADPEAEPEGEAQGDPEADPEADGDESDGGEDAGASAGKDDKNYAIRLAKAKSQRDQARAEKAELAARLAAIEAKLSQAVEPQQETTRADPRVELESQADGLYEKIEAARADGDVKQAATLQRELDKVNRQIGRLEAAAIASNTTGRMTENQTYNVLLDKVELAVPALNPASAEFDREAAAELQDTIDAFERAGLRPTDALRKAIKVAFRVDLDAPIKAAEPKAAPAEKPAPRKPNVGKAVDAASRQPPDASSRGVNRDEGNVRASELDEKTLAALPASKIAELRGDFV
jgi:type II secretory pathway component PulJ